MEADPEAFQSIPSTPQKLPCVLLQSLLPPSLSYLLTAKAHSTDSVQSSTGTSKSLFPYMWADIFIMQVMFIIFKKATVKCIKCIKKKHILSHQ